MLLIRTVYLDFPAWALWLLFFPFVDCREITTLTLQYKVLEEVPPGTVLGSLSEQCGWTDSNWTGGTFQLLQPSALFPLEINFQDGLLSTAGRLNREQLCYQKDPCVISFSVFAAEYFTLINVEVHVLDINDNEPQFPQVSQELEISERVSLHTRIPLDRALDSDIGSNALCSYFLSPSEHFALEIATAPDGTQQVLLVIVEEMDRELHSSFVLVLSAVDHGMPPRSGTTSVTVTVLDSNGSTPGFGWSSVTMEIREDALPGTLLASLMTTGLDHEPSGEMEYFFSKHVSEEVQRMFVVEGQTGHVVLQQRLDYEKNTVYEVDVQARALSTNFTSARCKLYVQVLDVNDNAPDIRLTWTGQTGVLPEAQEDSLAALITVFDPDSGSNGQVDCSIRQGNEYFTLKRINSNNYMLLTKAPLDRESCPEHNVTLLVQDRGIPAMSVIKHVTVFVSDVNDNAPHFEADSYHVSIAENTQPPSVLTAVRAHDADAGRNGEILYRISDPVHSEWLMIDADSGEIWAQTAFDAEKMAGFDFVVTAEDRGQPRQSSNVSVRVAVLDMNDNPPVVIKPELEGDRATITALVDPNTGCVLVPKEEGSSELTASAKDPLLFTVYALDADSSLNGVLVYDILRGNEAGLCFIDPQTGQVYLNGSNAEHLAGSEWDLELSVRDQGQAPLRTRLLVKVVFIRYYEHLPESLPVLQRLSPSVVMGICFVGLLAMSLLSLGLIVSLCKKDKRGNTAYNCREAEDAYSPQPRKPPKPIRKADIHVVPMIRQEAAEQSQAGGEAPPEDAWAESLGIPCHLTPTLFRTFKNWQSHSNLAALSGGQQRPFSVQRPRNPAARDVQSTDRKPSSSSWSQSLLSKIAPQDRPSTKAAPEDAHHCRTILRSLVRLSLAALAEQAPPGELTMESAPVQQISQLLSLLHQGQVQPMTNHRGNKYTAVDASCRNPNPNDDDLILKDGGSNKHHNWELLGEKIGNLLECPPGFDLDQLAVEDPAWMARLSLPLSTQYKDNVVLPDVQQFPSKQGTTGGEESHSFATFGKAAMCKQSPAEPGLTSTFLYEMNTLFEVILSQKVNPQA